MTFLQPANLFWAGLIALVLLVYLRLFAVQEVEAPALFLWREALARRPAWQRWQRFLSAALQIAILLALVLAAAEPAWVGEQRPKRTVAIVVDRSASMRATDVEPTRFDAALVAAKKQLAALGPGDRAMVLSDGAFTDILCPLTADPDAWSAALDAIKPTDGVGRLSETVALAQQRLAGEGEHEILVYTDGSSPDAPAVAKLANVKLATFGNAEAANLAFTRVAPRVSPAGEAETLVEAANFSGQAESAALVGRIEAGGRARRILKNTAGQLALDKTDALKADNSVDFPALSVQARTILLVGEVHPAIAAAARAIPGVKVETAATPPREAQANTIVVLQGTAQARLAPRAIVFEPTGEGDGWKAGELMERPLAVTQQSPSPVLGEVALAEVVVEGARPLALTGGWQVAAAAEGGLPIVAVRSDATGRAVLVNIDLARSDLTLRREFATLVRQAVDWLSERSAEYRPLMTTDDFVQLPAATTGKKRTANGLAIPPGVSEYGPLEQVAGWELRPPPAEAAAGGAVFANLLHADESNLAPRITSTIPEIAASAAPAMWPLWWIPAGVAVLLLVVEWSLYQRRVTI